MPLSTPLDASGRGEDTGQSRNHDGNSSRRCQAAHSEMESGLISVEGAVAGLFEGL